LELFFNFHGNVIVVLVVLRLRAVLRFELILLHLLHGFDVVVQCNLPCAGGVIVLTIIFGVFGLDTESSFGIEDFPNRTTSQTWLAIHQTDVEFPAIIRMRMTIVITELQFGKSLIHVRTLEVEDAVGGAVLSM